MKYDEFVGSVEEAKAFLEKGKAVWISSDCIGHTRNNMEQESYKKALQEYYGERLEYDTSWGACRYHYIFRLAK